MMKETVSQCRTRVNVNLLISKINSETTALLLLLEEWRSGRWWEHNWETGA